MPSQVFFRASGLPNDATASDIQQLGKRFCSAQEKLELVDAPSIAPSCQGDHTKTGLFSVKTPLPRFFDQLSKNSGEKPLSFQLRGREVTLDADFHGFTQLYDTPPGKPIVADIVALTGLNTNAYGSWKVDVGLERMWLRDFFSKDFSKDFSTCRTMTYGYPCNTSKSSHNIFDYCQTFLGELQKIRRTEQEMKRPLFFIAHSEGALIVAHSLVKAKFRDAKSGHSASLDSLLKATYGIMFFGIPNRGKVVEDLYLAMTNGGQHAERRVELIDEIQKQSTLLQQDLRRFTGLCGGFKICWFQPMKVTKKVAGDDGRWKQDARVKKAIEDTASMLQLPEALETILPVEADHANMVKFKTQQSQTYRDVWFALNKMLGEAVRDVPRRF